MHMPAPHTLVRPARRFRRARARVRGAVLVEAALVMPLLCVFLGLMVFFHRAYKAKISTRAAARENAFDVASRGCPNGSKATESSFQGAATTGSIGKTAAQKGDGTASALSFDHGTAKATKTATVSWKTAYGPWQKTIKPAESYVYCNENPIVTNAGSWFSFGTSEFKKNQ
ncbi:MAG: TadE family protein [Polyangiaceae bacterium]